MRSKLIVSIASVALVLTTASSVLAKEVNCGDLVSLTLPSDWQVVDSSGPGADGVVSLVIGKKDNSTSISLVGGNSEGHPAKYMAEQIGPSVGAVEAPAEYKGQYGFSIEAKDSGVKGFCIMSAGKDKFLLTCIQGELSNASGVFDSIKSSKYPELVPK